MRARTIAAGLSAVSLAVSLAGLATLGTALPAAAQSVGYVTGFPGKDPADDDGIGWGPAYRARTGRGPYDAIQGPAFQRPLRPVRAYEPGYDEEPAYAPRARTVRTRQTYKHRQHARAKPHRAHGQVMR